MRVKTRMVRLAIAVTIVFVLFSQLAHATTSQVLNDEASISFATSYMASTGTWGGNATDTAYLAMSEDMPSSTRSLFDRPVDTAGSTVSIIKPTGLTASEYYRIINKNYYGVSPFGTGNTGSFAKIPKSLYVELLNSTATSSNTYQLILPWPVNEEMLPGFSAQMGGNLHLYPSTAPYAGNIELDGAKHVGKRLEHDGNVYELVYDIAYHQRYPWTERYEMRYNGRVIQWWYPYTHNNTEPNYFVWYDQSTNITMHGVYDYDANQSRIEWWSRETLHANGNVTSQYRSNTQSKTIDLTHELDTLTGAGAILGFDGDYVIIPVQDIPANAQPQAGGQAYNRPTILQTISGSGGSAGLTKIEPGQVNSLSYQGDPINTSSGAHEINKTLLTLNGAEKFSFNIDYNSLLLSTGSLGRGWNHNYETSLALLQDGDIDLCWNSNRKNHFESRGDNTYISTDTATQYDTITKNQDNTYTLKRKDQSTYLFSTAGKLTQIRNGHGQKLALTYDEQNRLSSVTEPVSGKTLTLTYNASNFIETVTDNLNRQVEFGYEPGTNNLINITDASGEATSYSYNSDGRVTDALGPDGVSIFHNTYDSEGRVIAQDDSDPTNQIVTFSYDETSTPGQLITTVTDRNGHTKVLTHDDKYQLLSIKDELNQTTATNTYDASGNQTSSTDALNHTTRYTYDVKGNMTSVINAKDATTTLTYDDCNNLTRIENALGQAINYTYDANNNPLTVTDPLANTTSYTYDVNGFLLTKTLPRGGTTRYAYTNGMPTEIKSPSDNTSTISYDAAGRVISITDALGHETTTTYDDADNILAVTDPLGHTYSYTYDSFHNKLTKTDPKGFAIRYTYNLNGKLQTLTNALDETTTYEYDGEDRLTGITDALNHKTTLTYDAKGRLTSTTDALNHTTSTEYDALDNITAQKDAYGATILKISYDAINNPVTVTDALENTTTTSYDILSRIDSVTDPLQRSTAYAYDQAGRLESSTDALSGVSSQGYDADGNRVSISDPNNNKTQFNYDLAGRLSSQETSSSTTSYTYNAVDLIHEITNARNQKSTINYDAAGRVESITSPEGETTYTYDANNNVTLVTDPKGTITRTFDVLNRVSTYTDVHGDTISYTYDKAGNLSKLTYPGNKEVNYGYDAANRLTTVTDWEDRVTAYEYDNNNRLTKIFRPNSTTLTLTYNTKGELTHQKDEGPGGAVISEYDFTYDAPGQLITETDMAREGTGTPESAIMTYSANNRLATFNESTVTVDADGNMTRGPLNGGVQNFAYDSKNRLTQAGSVRYIYDAENNRVSSALTGEDTQTTLYTVNPNTTYSQTLIKTNPDGTKTYYIYGLGLLAQEDQTGYKTYHFDRRGSTVAIANAAGTVTDEFTYAPFGELINRTGNTETPFKFNGSYGVMTDSNGLYYMRARYYNPEIKRFINQDVLPGEINNSQSLNRYAYCNGNPVSLIDPFGLCGKEDGGGLDSALDTVQFGLDLAGLIPGAGEFFDLGNAGIYYLRGDSVNAGLSAFSAIPFAGWAGTGGKFINKGIGKIDDVAGVERLVVKESGSRGIQNLPALYDADFAARQILNNTSNVTPGGRVITAHAAERMVQPPPGRVPTTMTEVDEFLDTATQVRKINNHSLGDTITLRNANSTIKEIVVDAETGKRVITIINKK
jgi:RHS repeat-associated protein